MLNLGAALAKYNPSEVASDRDLINETLVSAGFGANGVFILPGGTNLTAASAAANASVTVESSRQGFYLPLGEDRIIKNTSMIGNYHGDYYGRYSVAAGGYLALTPDQVLYPLYEGTYTSTNSTAILLTFASKPPIDSLGFWSLRAYTSAGYLIDNPINVYALGDRSNLCFVLSMNSSMVLVEAMISDSVTARKTGCGSPESGVMVYLLSSTSQPVLLSTKDQQNRKRRWPDWYPIRSTRQSCNAELSILALNWVESPVTGFPPPEHAVDTHNHYDRFRKLQKASLAADMASKRAAVV